MPGFFGRYLDPLDIAQEVMVGLILVLAVTLGTGLMVQESSNTTVQMLVAIVGGNVAWGFIDAALHVMGCMMERGRNARLLFSLQKATDEREGLAAIGERLDDSLEPITSPEERSHFYRVVLKRLEHAAPETTRLRKSDLFGGIACFTLVTATVIPAIVPFLVLQDRYVALRVSNLLMLVLLFFVGYYWGRLTRAKAWRYGLIALLVGSALVAIAMALGG